VNGDDPRSLDVFPTFAGACAVLFRHALPLLSAFAVFIVPEVILFAIAAPNIGGTMFGTPALHVPVGEWLALLGVVLLAVPTGALSFCAATQIADDALAGRAVTGLGAAFGRAVARVPALIGAYLTYFLIVLLPMIPLFVLLALTTGLRGDEPPIAAVVGFLLGLGVVAPIVFAAGMYLRFGPVRAAVRDEGPLVAIRASIALVRGRFWRTVGYALLVSIVVQLVTSGLLLVSTVLHLLHPVSAFVVYGLTLTGCLAFQAVQEVALMRRIEAANAPPAPPDAADDLPVVA
jgi:hypothetical protein